MMMINKVLTNGEDATSLLPHDWDNIPEDVLIAYHSLLVLQKTRTDDMDYLTWMTIKATKFGLSKQTASHIRETCVCSCPQSVAENISKIKVSLLEAVGL